MTEQTEPASKKAQGPPSFFWQEKHYRSDDGRMITEYVVISGEAPDDFPRFIGQSVVRVPIPDGTGKHAAERDITFEIEGDSIEEAMANFPAAYERRRAKEARRLQGELQKRLGQNIVPATSMPSGTGNTPRLVQ